MARSVQPWRCLAGAALLAAGAACVAAPAPLLVDINTGNRPIADSSPGDAAPQTATQTGF
jgi:hypothetical protein